MAHKILNFLIVGASTMVLSPPAMRRDIAHDIAHDITSRSDEDALRSDWEMVGGHLRSAMDRMIKLSLRGKQE